MPDLQQTINQKRELLTRETYPREVINYSGDMPSDQKDRYINYLVDKCNDAALDNKAMHLVLEDMMKNQDELMKSQNDFMSQLSTIKKALEEETEKRKAAERRTKSLEAKLRYARKDRFGDKSQKVKKGQPANEGPDRNDEKDGFDGTNGTLSTESSTKAPKQEPSGNGKKERDMTNRPEEYKTMHIQGKPEEHPSDLSKVPGRILDRKMVKVFSLRMCLVEEHFEMVQYVEKGRKPRWGYFPTEGHPEVVTKFEGTKATPEFLQAIAYEVCVKNVTFGLLHQWLTDMGMTISENTLHNWLEKGKRYLDELIVVLKSIALEKDSIVNCDETWCKVRKYDHYKKCYIWVLVNKAEKTAIFFYEDGSRGRDVLTHFLGDSELKCIMTDGYNAYVFIGDVLKSASLKDTDHQICFAHYRAKLVKAADQGEDPKAIPFLESADYFFGQERIYDKERITPEERGRRRQRSEVKEKVEELKRQLELELSRPDYERSEYLTEALHYLDRFWDGLFLFLKDGRYPIDNNLAERTIRKITTQRNSMLHFGSDEGVMMAATYHSIISTVKLHGKSAWEYLGSFFRNIFEGYRDYVRIKPANIGLAMANQ